MLRFKKFIIEKELPKNLKLTDVSFDKHSNSDNLPNLTSKEVKKWEDFINNLNNWVDVAGQRYAKKLGDFKDNIPERLKKGGKLNRALKWVEKNTIDMKELKKVIDKKSFTPKEIESWSRGKNEIVNFFKGNKFSKRFGIIIKKNIPSSKVVLDVKKFVNDKEMIKIGAKVRGELFSGVAQRFADKENEILVKLKNAIKLDDKLEYYYDNKQLKNFEEFEQKFNEVNK